MSNGFYAPIPAIRGTEIERQGSTLKSNSWSATADRQSAAKRTFRPATARRRSGRQEVAPALGLAKTSKRSAA
jgi:hypothetical protein